jgi:hypothetical protein
LLPGLLRHSQHLRDDVCLKLRKRSAAHQIGFVNKIAEPDQLIVRAFEIDGEIAHDLVRLIDDVQVGCLEGREIRLAAHLHIDAYVVVADGFLKLFFK